MPRRPETGPYVVTYWFPASTMPSEQVECQTWRDACAFMRRWVRKGWCCSVGFV